MPSRKKKIIPLEDRYTYYLAAQERVIASLQGRDYANNPMGRGRFLAVKNVVADLKLYRATFPDPQPRIHALLVTIQSYIGACQDDYKLTSDADKRSSLLGSYNEYKRQVEQIRNLLTPMEEVK